MARFTRLRETTFDLYIERDRLPGYYRILTLASVWLVIAGYILFAIAFSTVDDDLNTSRNVLTASASSFLIVGYIAVVTIALLSNSLLFLVDAVIYPILIASSSGLMLTSLFYGLQSARPVPRIYVSIPLVTACVTITVSIIILGVVYRELSQIKRRDERRRWHITMNSYGNIAGRSSLGSHHRSLSEPEDEAQRRQLMRLLHDRNEHPSMENMRGTYKIDLPDEVPAERRGRSSSTPKAHRINISRILPWGRSDDGTFKDARERRREEIERSGLPTPVTPAGGWYSRSRSNSREAATTRAQYGQPTSWGWPPATRYA